MDVIWLYPSVEMRLCPTWAGHSFWYGQSWITHHLDATAAMPHNALVNVPMLTIVETSIFARRAEKLLSSEEHEELLSISRFIRCLGMRFRALAECARCDLRRVARGNPAEYG